MIHRFRLGGDTSKSPPECTPLFAEFGHFCRQTRADNNSWLKFGASGDFPAAKHR